MASCKRLFGGACKKIVFDCSRCGRIEAHVSLAGIIAKKHHDAIVTFIRESHDREHHQEDRANGTKHP